MAIAIERKANGPKSLTNGYGEIEWLPRTHKYVRGFKCILKAGSTVSPKLFADKTVVFIFSQGIGYVTTPQKAFNINEISFFVPEFNKDHYSIVAATDMEYMMIITDMVQSDWDAYENLHVVLPLFRKLSESEPYVQNCKGPKTESWSVIHSGTLARVLMGVVRAEGAGEGTFEKGHPSVDQWNYALPTADFELSVDNKDTVDQYEGDWSFVPAGLDHALTGKKGKKTFYVWFEHKTEEIPQGRH